MPLLPFFLEGIEFQNVPPFLPFLHGTPLYKGLKHGRKGGYFENANKTIRAGNHFSTPCPDYYLFKSNLANNHLLHAIALLSNQQTLRVA